MRVDKLGKNIKQNLFVSDPFINVSKWGKETYDVMMSLAKSEDANVCGVQSMSAYILQDRQHENVLNLIILSSIKLNCEFTCLHAHRCHNGRR